MTVMIIICIILVIALVFTNIFWSNRCNQSKQAHIADNKGHQTYISRLEEELKFYKDRPTVETKLDVRQVRASALVDSQLDNALVKDMLYDELCNELKTNSVGIITKRKKKDKVQYNLEVDVLVTSE